jgi:heme oxygenase
MLVDDAAATAIAPPNGFAKRLKEGTQAAHKKAESISFIRSFIKGDISKEAYCQLLVNLRSVYCVLEEELDKHWNLELIEPLHFPDELERTLALDADLDFFQCHDLKPTPSAISYVARLREVGDTNPALLVAHAYTRYLGDLSGGQVLKRATIRRFKLGADGKGVKFYEFSRIKDLKRFKEMYRARLDALPVSQEAAAELVDEANHAFDLNSNMFLELGAPCHDDPDNDVLPTRTSAPAGCPFAALIPQGTAMPKDHPPIGVNVSAGGEVSTVNSKAKVKGAPPACPLVQIHKSAPRVAAVLLPAALCIACRAGSLLNLTSW